MQTLEAGLQGMLPDERVPKYRAALAAQLCPTLRKQQVLVALPGPETTLAVGFGAQERVCFKQVVLKVCNIVKLVHENKRDVSKEAEDICRQAGSLVAVQKERSCQKHLFLLLCHKHQNTSWQNV